MSATTTRTGITFAVDDVTPAKKPLPECRAHEAARKTIGGFEAASDYHGTVVQDIWYHPLLAAVHTAFSQHRPLVLTPDSVWITIAQGVAHHMRIHGERLRSRFVSHQGKLDLVFLCDWPDGSPENPWGEAFEAWANQVRHHVGESVHDALVCDFSTSGPVELAASRVVLLDTFQRYFHYVAYCVCGIPSVTLEGTPADWDRVREKAAALEAFDLDWWLPHLLPVCDQFVRASRGDVDLDHWQNICKLRKQYGGDVINGWVAKLFPYLREFTGGPCTRRNPIFETGDGFQSFVAPPWVSCAPFTWRNAVTGEKRAMEALGGFLGVSQDPGTMALRPKVGWAVRNAAKLDVLLARLDDHTTFPGTEVPRGDYLPEDLCAFYHRTNGAELFGGALRIAPYGAMSPLDWGEVPGKYGFSRGPQDRIWHRFAELPGGGWLAINLDRNLHHAPWRDVPELQAKRDALGYGRFVPIIRGSDATRNMPGANPVVALSFSELLEGLLDGGPAWVADRDGYGDAELFTRREGP